MFFQRSNKRTRLVYGLLLITSCFLFVFSISACGRRGDPVLIAPYDENIVQEDTDKDQERLTIEEEKVDRKGGALMPDVPAGLMGLYTQEIIVLTWDEVKGQDVRRYKVYRSAGDEFAFIGETAAPAFTDRDIKPDTKYYYRVTASGILESQPSKEIAINTEVR